MFEKEIETFEKIVRNNTIANAPAVSLRNILESNIPQNVKSFFRGEVEWLLYKERVSEKHSSKFNYTQQDIQLLQEQMDMLLVYNFSFSSQEFSLTLDRCIHFLFNYLCRPQWTLESYIFEESYKVSFQELAIKFRSCSDYGYYWKILEKHLVQKSKNELTKDDFIKIIKRIDAEVIKQQSAEDLSRMIEPFFGFVNYIQQHLYPTDDFTLPTKAALYFFEDKKISSLVKKLSELRENGKASITYGELTALIKETFAPQNFSLEEELKPQKKEDVKVFDDSEIDAPKLLLPERERKLIVQILFRNAETAYATTTEKIISSDSWDDASLQLDHFFTMNDVDPFSREAIVFTNALQNYFLNLNQNGNFS